MKENKTMFGIDLGTTNSAISAMTGSEGLTSSIIKLSNGKNTLPSCVQWTKKEGFTVGDKPYNERYKSNVVYSIKRHMGSSHITTLTDDEGNTITLTPEEVSAEILKALCKEATKAGYGEVYNVTITVPAYFNDLQRKATIKAGELAGLNVVAIVNEPTSASLAYGLDKSHSTGNILVYDLGGGTFDASLLQVEHTGTRKKIGLIKLASETKEQSIINVLSNGGNNQLGGDDIDRRVLELICKELDSYLLEKGHKTNTLTELPKETIERIVLQIEMNKKLSVLGVPMIKVNTTLTTGLLVDEHVPLSPKFIKQATQEVFNRTIEAVEECLETSPEKSFGRVVLVGGSTKSEVLRDLIKDYFTEQVIFMELNPDESVAIGAAVMTSIKMGGSDMKLFDVIPLPIGIASVKKLSDDTFRQDVFNKVIQKDAQLPAKGVFFASNTKDDGSGIDIEVYQGTKRRASHNTLIGKIEIDSLPKKPAGEVKIKVHMMVDLNGVLSVKVLVDEVEYKKTFTSVFGGTTTEDESPSTDLSSALKEAEDLLGTSTVGFDNSQSSDNSNTLTDGNKGQVAKLKNYFEILSTSSNPKVKRWTSNLYKWDVSDLERKEMLEKLKAYDNNELEEQVVVDAMHTLRKKYK